MEVIAGGVREFHTGSVDLAPGVEWIKLRFSPSYRSKFQCARNRLGDEPVCNNAPYVVYNLGIGE